MFVRLSASDDALTQVSWSASNHQLNVAYRVRNRYFHLLDQLASFNSWSYTWSARDL